MPLVFMLLVVTLVVMCLMIVLLSARYEPGEFLVTFRSITYQPDLSSPADMSVRRMVTVHGTTMPRLTAYWADVCNPLNEAPLAGRTTCTNVDTLCVVMRMVR